VLVGQLVVVLQYHFLNESLIYTKNKAEHIVSRYNSVEEGQ
jgi:hypothetical protein